MAGKFRVEKVLGKGGMGVVVAATHVDLDQRVALKFLLPEAASHPDLVLRFAREARAAAKIKSEHGVKILDVGTLPSGLPYMVMEHLEGEDLKQLLKRAGPLTPELAAGYILQSTEALAEAHVLGIVHRDLKPANLFLARHANGEPLVKVLDFGISKTALAPSDVALTRDATMMGSPRYISPEQLLSAKSADARSDIWSLGVILYELLTGRKPFEAKTLGDLVMAIHKPHKPVRELRPDVPEGLGAVVDRCLAKEPAQRFQDVGQLAWALAPFGPPYSDASAERVSRLFGRAPSVKPAAVVQPAAAGHLAATRVATLPPAVIPPAPPPAAQLVARPPSFNPAATVQSVARSPERATSSAATAPSTDVSGAVGITVALLALAAFVAAAFFLTSPGPAPSTPRTDPSTHAPEGQGQAAPKHRGHGSEPPPRQADAPEPTEPPPSDEAAAAPSSSAAPSVSAAASAGPVASSTAPPEVATAPDPAPSAPSGATSVGVSPNGHPVLPSKRAPTCRMTSYIDPDGNKRFKRTCD